MRARAAPLSSVRTSSTPISTRTRAMGCAPASPALAAKMPAERSCFSSWAVSAGTSTWTPGGNSPVTSLTVTGPSTGVMSGGPASFAPDLLLQAAQRSSARISARGVFMATAAWPG